MDELTAAMIQTWLDEPDLLREPGQPDPVFTDSEIEQSRLICATVESQYVRIH
jgi:hypothetical protein